LAENDDRAVLPQGQDMTIESPIEHQSYERIGNYRLWQRIGEGSMGEVYLAEQEQPIQRKVALKIIKRGMDTREVVARFETERQALAMMDHPCIAKVFDAGATERGRPYFAMEYVQGVPITEHCDTQRLSIRDRLELMLKVCDGVQHAHQKAIIHRDIKASNVLVTIQDGQAVPKIIDFGVAKATSQRLTDRTMYTELGQLIGTPEYMSPEQAEMTGQNIDTRTDVYSLGVLLYVMLVGELPFESGELRRAGFDEIRRRIREDEPPRPSSRLKAMGDRAERIAQSRRTSAPKLQNQLRGDLDWIIMKALEKDRTRRYEAASELASDIKRHLRSEPVLASPPSATYRVRKFVNRHRRGVLAAGLVTLAVLLGIVGTTIGMMRALKAERVASQEAEAARQVSDFMVGMFEVSDPDKSRGNTITAREILDKGAMRIKGELDDQPSTQARLMNTIGNVYQKLGLYDEAGPYLEDALALRQQIHAADNTDLAASLADLANLYTAKAKYEEAEPLLQRAIVMWERVRGSDHLDLAAALGDLASVYRRQGKYEAAEPLYLRARDIRLRILGANHPDVASSLNSLAILYWNQGRYDEAESSYKQALAIWTGVYGENHPDVAKGLNNLALLYHEQKRYATAQPIYQRALAIYEKVLGPDHPRLAGALNNLALVYQDQQMYGEAEALYRRALAIREKVLGADHPDLGKTLNNLANLNRLQGKYAAAESLCQRALTIREMALGANHPDVAWSLRDLGRLYAEQQKLAQAERCYQRSLAIFESSLGPEHPDLAEILGDYALLLKKMGRTEEAGIMHARAGAILNETDKTEPQ
jgi:serine/threonine protein kinase/tetratricopeptide (TPR) repeat protein